MQTTTQKITPKLPYLPEKVKAMVQDFLVPDYRAMFVRERGRFSPLSDEANLLKCFTIRYETYDLREWKLNETLRRAKACFQRQGGFEPFNGGIKVLPNYEYDIVLRKSPFAHGAAKEHFTEIILKRLYTTFWDCRLELNDPKLWQVADQVAKTADFSCAVRIMETKPAILAIVEHFLELERLQKQEGQEVD
ncbi:hypothetical protein GpartN1_g2585.t1 [Galdieria partita]|uniref:Uncharacterized protein n=1 Tax=Galdieria partita TaxID=83374 RepID=A0A9C7UPC7_9RHOD|nr:hypothetical protein GpartN1_g2585.t1 [Galdieria partita]